MKHSTAAAVTCAAALVASLTACGAGDDKSAPGGQTGGSNPSMTATSQPTTTPTPPLPTPTKSGPAAFPAHSTYTYGGLKVVVNVPADIPRASRPSLGFFLDFLEPVNRTVAQNKLDPLLAGVSSADVVKYVQTFVAPGAVRGIGSMTYTIDKVHSAGTPGYARITGCVDQSKVVLVRKDGSHYVDANGKKYQTLKMTAEISSGPRVTAFTFAVGAC